MGMAGNSGANPATHFGRQVLKERRARGWSVHELARRSGISAGHLSRIENGLRQPTDKLAAAMDTVFPERRGWFTEYYDDSQAWTPPGYRHWAEHEDTATHVWAWSPGVIDGLAQTPEYARAQLETVPGVPAEVVAARLTARIERQRRILHRDRPPSVWLLIDELALFRLVGSAKIMAEQMARIVNVAKLPHATVQVTPATANAAAGAALIVTEKASYTEHLGGGAVYLNQETFTAHARLITTIQGESYRASESVRLVERVNELWESGESPLTAALRGAPASRQPTAREPS